MRHRRRQRVQDVGLLSRRVPVLEITLPLYEMNRSDSGVFPNSWLTDWSGRSDKRLQSIGTRVHLPINTHLEHLKDCFELRQTLAMKNKLQP